MKQTNYGSHKQEIFRLGFGSWQLGNTEFWGYMSKEDGIKLVKEAIKQGVNFFDTAPGYAHGLSEQIIGQAIKGQRDKVYISTKFGHTADGETDFSPLSMREQLQSSLDRLETDYVDALLLHNPPIEILEGQTEHHIYVKELKDEGLIRGFGVSIDTKEEFELVLKHLDVDYIEILFNVFFQDVISCFKKAHEKGIKLIAKVPLDSGWLTGKYDEFSDFEGIRTRWDDETIERRASLVKALKHITKKQELTRYAMSFIMSFPEITVVIPGIKHQTHLKDHLKHVDFKISEDMKNQMIKLYEEEIKDQPLTW